MDLTSGHKLRHASCTSTFKAAVDGDSILCTIGFGPMGLQREIERAFTGDNRFRLEQVKGGCEVTIRIDPRAMADFSHKLKRYGVDVHERMRSSCVKDGNVIKCDTPNQAMRLARGYIL